MAGGVRHDECPARRCKESIRNVDRDALLAFGLKAIDEQREVDVVAGGTVLAAVALQRHELIFENELRVVEKPPDEG